MAQTTVNIRMDEELKKQFDTFCKELGLTMSAAFCVFAKTAVREQRIPFELKVEADPFYSAENMARLDKAIADIEAGKGTVHELIEVDDDE